MTCEFHSMGFRIAAQNSAEDSYIAGGAFNTWSREKIMFISVQLHYALG